MGDLGKLIVAKGFKKLPIFNKSPDLVTLAATTSAGATAFPFSSNGSLTLLNVGRA